jgi:hypothetical protein
LQIKEEVLDMDQTRRSGATVDWNTEDEYWRENYANRPYVGQNRDYERWRPAYRYGFESAQQYGNKRWQEVEPDLRSGWDRYEHRGDQRSTWEQIKDAVRDGWDRLTGNR